MRLRYMCRAAWPWLAWVAELRRNADEVIVTHGKGVEVRPDWFCEAAWDGEFSLGEFDRTDIVAGSGGRLRGERLLLVSPGSTVDRLQFLDLGERIFVSNSLACLLQQTDATLDPAFPGYTTACFSVIKGLDRYVRCVPSSRGQVEFCYFDNLHWDGRALSRVDKPRGDRKLDSFSDYHGFVSTALERMFSNMRAAQRSERYAAIGTLSTGYDSTFATALTRPLGLREVICFERADRRDSGVPNAHRLGVEPISVSVDQWRSLESPEIDFIAGDGIGEEVHFSALKALLRGRMLITGYHGDKVWAKDAPYLSPMLVRGDMSGMALTEFRLSAGFLHCPIAFFGARQVARIRHISNLPEMAPWDTGGNYSRPICRRVIEEAGLPRDAFGTRKSYASRWFAIHQDYMTAASRQSYCQWLRDHRGSWLERGRVPPSTVMAYDRWRIRTVGGISKALVAMPGYYRLQLHKVKPLQLFANLDENEYRDDFPLYGLRRFVMPWAVEEAKRLYYRDRTAGTVTDVPDLPAEAASGAASY